MERFTTMSTAGPHITDGLNIRLHGTCVCSSTGPAVDRLYAYEETGLTPEEVKELIEHKDACNAVPDNAEAYISVALFENNKCNMSFNGVGENLIKLIAVVIDSMSEGNINFQKVIFDNLMIRTATLTTQKIIGEIKNG